MFKLNLKANIKKKLFYNITDQNLVSTLLAKLSKKSLSLPTIEIIPVFKTNQELSNYFDYLSYRILEDSYLKNKNWNFRRIGVIFYIPCQHLTRIISTVL